jgi:hypothetical protein
VSAPATANWEAAVPAVREPESYPVRGLAEAWDFATAAAVVVVAAAAPRPAEPTLVDR